VETTVVGYEIGYCLNTYKDICIMVRIASFDIGKKNLAFYVEETDTDTIIELKKRYKSIPKKKLKRIKGRIPPEVEEILQELYTSGKHIPRGYGVFDLREYEDNILDIHIRANLFELLDSYEWLWDECDIICIEQQFFNPHAKARGGGANMDAIKIGECLFSWFLYNYHTFKIIEYFGAQFKTQSLGAPHRRLKMDRKKKYEVWKPLSKQDRKDWSVEKSEEIFLARAEAQPSDKDACLEIAHMFNKAKKGNRKRREQKMDDVADCVVQLQAFKYRKLIVN
jgi:hypothetical protein